MRSRPVQARAIRIAIIDASVPELWKRMRSTDGISACTARAQAISCSVLAPSCGAVRELRGGRGHHLRVPVAEQQGAVPHHVVDVLVAVDVPLAGAVATGHEDREGQQAAHLVGGSPGKHVESLAVQLRGAGMAPLRTRG